MRQPNTSKTRRLLFLAAAMVTVVTCTQQTTFAAACTPPGTDYGTVTMTANVSSAGTYRIWTRMSAPSSSANT